MFIKLCVLFYACCNIFLNTHRKDITTSGVHPAVVGVGPTFFGHPILLTVACLLGFFILPNNLSFYIAFVGVCLCYLLYVFLMNAGLSKSNFALANAVASSAVVFQALASLIFLNESFSSIQWYCFVIIVILVTVINWPKGAARKFDKGILLISLSLIPSALCLVLLKLSANISGSYFGFIIGRTVVDLVIYLVAVLVIFFFQDVKSREATKNFFKCKGSLSYIVILNLVISMSLFVIPLIQASEFAVLAVISQPLSFIFGKYKYKEEYSFRMILECFALIAVILVFLLNGH